jgi:ATP-dependent helicase/nuclease subunit A
VEAGDLLHAVDRVRQVFEDGGSLADAADALEADSEFTTEVESLPLEPGRTDVVRLMNLHKAKGLEANVVFLADPCGGMKPRVDVYVKREGNQALGWFQVEKKFENGYGGKLLGQHADWETHAAAELPFLEAEEKRLLYVAATRAREMLVVSYHGKGTAWGVLNKHLGNAKALKVPATVVVALPAAPDCSPQVQAEANAARAAAGDRANQPSWSVTSVTAEAKGLTRQTRVEADVEGDATRVVAQTSSAHRADAGFAWGTLIHGLLEHAMRHPAATRADLRRLAMWLTVEEPQLRDVIDVALDTVESVSKAEFWVEAHATVHSAEAPFMNRYGAAVMNGVIDLLYQGKDGWKVIDYKTDRILGDRYEKQIGAYRIALGAVGCEVMGATVVSVRSEQP